MILFITFVKASRKILSEVKENCLASGALKLVKHLVDTPPQLSIPVNSVAAARRTVMLKSVDPKHWEGPLVVSCRL